MKINYSLGKLCLNPIRQLLASSTTPSFVYVLCENNGRAQINFQLKKISKQRKLEARSIDTRLDKGARNCMETIKKHTRNKLHIASQ